MLNDLVNINKNHEAAAKTIYDRIVPELHDKYILTISGEVASGKCEIAQVLGRLFKSDGKKVKILHMDDYYLIPPLDRTKWRLANGIQKIGFDEYDWKRIRQNVSDFQQDARSSLPCVDLITSQVDEVITHFQGIDMLIVNGLYSLMLKEADLHVFIELTYKETFKAQIAEQKENMDEFRMKVLEREHEVVQSLKPGADFYVDFDNSGESFHL